MDFGTGNRDHPLIPRIEGHAANALRIVEHTMFGIADLDVGHSALRDKFLTSLLRAAADNARSAMLLLATDTSDLASSAMLLHRAQLDKFIHGVYFAKIAPDNEFVDYNDRNVRPSQPAPNIKPCPSCGRAAEPASRSTNYFARKIEKKLRLAGFLAMYSSAWGTLSSHTHGGDIMRDSYVDESGGVGSNVPASNVLTTIKNSVELVRNAATIEFGDIVSERYELFRTAADLFNTFLAAHRELRAIVDSPRT